MACFTSWDIQGCGCSSSGCSQTFHVVGCNANPLSGATVGVWTDATKATSLASGTTDGSGNVTLSWATATCTVYYEVSLSPWTTTTASTTLGAGSTTTVTLAPQSGYHCVTCCNDPLPGTLHGGGFSLFYSSGLSGWSDAGSSLVFFTNCTLSLNDIDCGLAECTQTSLACPPSLSISFNCVFAGFVCPDRTITITV